MPAHPAYTETSTINVAIIETQKPEGEHGVKPCVDSCIKALYMQLVKVHFNFNSHSVTSASQLIQAAKAFQLP